jgi:hypothetical protein
MQLKKGKESGSNDPAMTPLKWSRLSSIVVCKMIVPTERNDAQRISKIELRKRETSRS